MNQMERIYADLIDRAEKILKLPSGGFEDWIQRREKEYGQAEKQDASTRAGGSPQQPPTGEGDSGGGDVGPTAA